MGVLERLFSRRSGKRVSVSLTDLPHWDVRGCDFYRFFAALPHLLPTPGAFLGLAEGAWPPEVRAFLSKHVAHLEKPLLEALPREFQSAALLCVDPALMAEFTELAHRHAEPEIAIHLVAGVRGAVLLEWYDAPDDPVALADSLEETVVARFAAETGGSFGRARPGV